MHKLLGNTAYQTAAVGVVDTGVVENDQAHGGQTTEKGTFFNKHDLLALSGCGQCRADTGGASADDDDVITLAVTGSNSLGYC